MVHLRNANFKFHNAVIVALVAVALFLDEAVFHVLFELVARFCWKMLFKYLV